MRLPVAIKNPSNSSLTTYNLYEKQCDKNKPFFFLNFKNKNIRRESIYKKCPSLSPTNRKFNSKLLKHALIYIHISLHKDINVVK